VIKLTRLNGKEFVVNADLIETIESTPDTVVTLVNEHRYVVKESVDDVVKKVMEYKRSLSKPIWYNEEKE